MNLRYHFIAMKLILSIIVLCPLLVGGAVPTFESFNPNQFVTNALTINYSSDWTNELGVIRPATINTEVTLTNLNLYETFVMPAKVVLLTLGTNELNVATNSTWFLNSPTNDAAEVTLSLSAGKYQGQLLFITSQNGDGAFTLPDESEQYDVPGALVDLQGDWVGTTNRGVILQYTAPDWIEMARFNPASTNGPFPPSGGGGDAIFVNTDGIVEPAGGQTATNRFRFISGAADNATNVALVVDTAVPWTDGLLGAFRNNGVNKAVFNFDGTLVIGEDTIDVLGNPPGAFAVQRGLIIQEAVNQQNAIELFLGDSPDWNSYGYTVSGPSSFGTNSVRSSFIFEAGQLTDSSSVEGYADIADTYLRLKRNGTDRLVFKPTTLSTGSAVAHFVDTSNVLTNGDSLFEIRNQGVDHFRVAGDSGYGGAGDRFLSDDGTYRTASSSSVITYTNQFVYSGKVTYNADVYVTNATIYVNGVDVKTVSYGGACSDETTALVAGAGKLTFRMPHALTVTAVRASLTTAQTSGGLVTVDIHDSGTTILSTKITLDNAERTSTTAATPPVISDTALADDAEVTVDLDSLGDGTAKGLKIWITGIRLP